MLKKQSRLVSFGLFVLDEAVTLACFFLAYFLRRHALAGVFTRSIQPLERYYPLLPVIVLAWGLSFWFLGLYRSHRTVSLHREVGEVVRAVLVGGLMLALFIFMSRTGPYMSRIVVAFFIVLDMVAVSVERLAVRAFGRYVRAQGRNFRNIVIVGTDERARGFTATVEQHPYWGINVLGYLPADGAEDQAVEPNRILGKLEDLPRIIQEKVVDEVIFVVAPAKISLFEDAFLQCEEQGVKTRLVMEYLPRQLAKVYVEMVDGLPVMTFSTAPIDVTALFVKRAIDVVLSALLLVILSPLLLFIALAVKLSSPGPVLFRQTRCGLNGRRFTLLKFRSMHRDAEERKAELAHLNLMDGPVFKAKDDPRVTPVGRFLRAFSLDELPQLVNILRGDMSFVGPRPPIPEEVSLYERWQRRRLSMKPGLTGLWQVSGRNTVDFNTWMKLDLEYIDRWSLWLDVKIFLKTIPVVLSRRGAM